MEQLTEKIETNITNLSRVLINILTRVSLLNEDCFLTTYFDYCLIVMEDYRNG